MNYSFNAPLSVRQKIARLGALAGAVGTGMANAALDTAVQTTLDGAKTDVTTIGGIVFGIAVAIVLYKWFKRAL